MNASKVPPIKDQELDAASKDNTFNEFPNEPKNSENHRNNVTNETVLVDRSDHNEFQFINTGQNVKNNQLDSFNNQPIHGEFVTKTEPGSYLNRTIVAIFYESK